MTEPTFTPTPAAVPPFAVRAGAATLATVVALSQIQDRETRLVVGLGWLAGGLAEGVAAIAKALAARRRRRARKAAHAVGTSTDFPTRDRADGEAG